MAGLSGRPFDEPVEVMSEVGDMEVGSETELLSGSDGASRTSCRPACRAAGRGFTRLRIGAATGLLSLVCVLVLSSKIVFGPARSSSISVGHGILLDEIKGDDDKAGCNCAVDEEFFGGLCYKKCSYLTHGQYPIRTSAMTCCESHPCGLFNQRHDVGLCSGFSVAGGNSSACPHPPGCCLPDEEMLVGQCYKKCNLLTDGEFPFRVAPTTCCDRDSEIMCFIPHIGYSRTNPKFDVGGGGGLEAGPHSTLHEVDSDEAKAAALSTLAPTTPAPTMATTAAPAEARITQPALPDWYKDMQAKQRQKGSSAGTAQASTAAPPRSGPTPPPVPHWAGGQEAAHGGAASAEPAPAAPATPEPVAPAPTATPAAAASAPAVQVEPTSPPAAGTTVPEWLQEIVAKPDDAAARSAGPVAAPVAAPAPAPSPADAYSGGQASKMPDWASSMLNDEEASGSQDVATAADGTQQQPPPAAGAGDSQAPPVPDWAKDYMAPAE